MTIPRRTDGANVDNRRARLLAELPYVGEVAPEPVRRPVAEEIPQQKLRSKSNHPAFAELDDDYPEEREAPRHSTTRKLRYVDQAHVDFEPEDDEWEERERSPRGRQTQPRSQIVKRRPGQSRQRAAGMGRVLSGIQEQTAPYAGLIVTAALIACAGLLILVMASGKQDDLDKFALPGFSVDASGDLSAGSSPPLAGSDLLPETAVPDSLEYEPPQVSEPVSAPVTAAPADASAAIPQPVIEQITESSVPLGQLSFPVTSTPLALDYSKAFIQSPAGLLELPAVAERDTAASAEPINR